MFVSRSMPKPKAVAAVILGACLMASVVIFDGPAFMMWSDNGDGDEEAHPILPRRSLRPRGSPMFSWARTLLLPLSTTPEPSKETVIFWHIPKSGGTTAKSIYSSMGMGKSTRVYPTPSKILEAKEMGLLEPGQVDIIFTSSPGFAVKQIFDSTHKGRVLALFRHPVERLISKFYYLQVAQWEKKYNPDWKDMDILDWAKTINTDNNHMVKRLAGKIQRDKATETDLRMAMRTVKQRFVVGLMHEMEESIHRFNTVMGIDEEEEYTKRVMYTFFGNGSSMKTNFNSHPKVEKGSPAWDLLAEQNALDIRLYEYILVIFQEQKEIIDSYRTSVAMDQDIKKK